MKYYDLLQINDFLSKFKYIISIERVEDTLLKIRFENNIYVYFKMKRGNSSIFMCENYKKSKIYQAPFDIILSKRISKTKIINTQVVENERILRFYVQSEQKYLSIDSILQFEFTGRNTNIIILDKNFIVCEALRHIDINTSSRQVKIAETLKEIPPSTFIHKETPKIVNVEDYLYSEYKKLQKENLNNLKMQKRLQLGKKIEKLQENLNNLSSKDELEKQANEFALDANLILSNLHKIKAYSKDIIVQDYEGKNRIITLSSNAKTVQMSANLLFAKSKKMKQKAKFLHIEKEGIEEKLNFYEKLDKMILCSKRIEEIEILFPKQKHQRFKEKENSSYEVFFMEGYKIQVGKNQKGNSLLLKNAKKSDIWFHLKDTPSAHVIIVTQKQNIQNDVLRFAAKLCVDFSLTKEGLYLVDYTPRRNVKIVQGANVTYVDNKTIYVKKEQ